MLERCSEKRVASEGGVELYARNFTREMKIENFSFSNFHFSMTPSARTPSPSVARGKQKKLGFRAFFGWVNPPDWPGTPRCDGFRLVRIEEVVNDWGGDERWVFEKEEIATPASATSSTGADYRSPACHSP